MTLLCSTRAELDELAVNFRADNLISIKNNGTDLPGVPPESIDFVFSFGVFVHLDLDLIDAYLHSFKSVLKCGGSVVLQYADKTKPLAKLNNGFAQNTPEQMRKLILSHGYTIEEEDTGTMWHSSIVRFTTYARGRSLPHIAPAATGAFPPLTEGRRASTNS